MTYDILKGTFTFMIIPQIYGSSTSLDDILHHKNVPMIRQSLGSNCYLSLIYSLTAHSITYLCHNTGAARYSFMFNPKSASCIMT